jgi:hypothetical protein
MEEPVEAGQGGVRRPMSASAAPQGPDYAGAYSSGRQPVPVHQVRAQLYSRYQCQA